MKTSIDYWFACVNGQGENDEVFRVIATELPSLSSLILDRSCQFQCQHCIFQNETSSKNLPDVNAVLHVLKELPNVKVVHEGRQLTRKQLPLLKAICDAKYQIGIIESGTFVPMIDDILKTGLKFDWIDISVDGPKDIHNLQRNSSRAWDVATEGIQQARRVINPKGKLTSLMTLSSLNSKYVLQTGEEVFTRGVDEWHITTMSIRKGLEELKASEKQLEGALNDMVDFSKSPKKIFLRIYNLEDMRSLISIFGKGAFSKILKDAKVTQNALVLDIGLPLFFYPASLAPSETLVIDTDNWWRLPYCIKYTLSELQSGRDMRGQDISVYNITEITQQTDVVQLYRQAVAQWQKHCGERQLIEERALLQNLF